MKSRNQLEIQWISKSRTPRRAVVDPSIFVLKRPAGVGKSPAGGALRNQIMPTSPTPLGRQSCDEKPRPFLFSDHGSASGLSCRVKYLWADPLETGQPGKCDHSRVAPPPCLHPSCLQAGVEGGARLVSQARPTSAREGTCGPLPQEREDPSLSCGSGSGLRD